MYIVQVAPEVAPIAKVGGLADVMMGLSRELKWKGHAVDIVIPKYDCIDVTEITIKPRQGIVRSYFGGSTFDNSLWQTQINSDLSITFLESHHPNRFFERGCIYGCLDDIDRFLYFSRAVLDWLSEQDETPDIIHIHDWETAAIALLIRQGVFKKRFEKTRVVLTIHNIAYQGKCSTHDLEKIGLSGAWFNAPQRMQDDVDPCLNLLKGGIVFSDHITTVSETYAKEVLTHEGGKGLQLIIDQHKQKFSGILNGIDYSYWNPEVDPYLNYTFSSKKEPKAGKEKNKASLCKEIGLSFDSQKPLVAAIMRLVQQKGIEMVKHAIITAHDKGMQCVVLGTTSDPVVHEEFLELSHKYAQDPDVRILLQQEEKLAHKIYAASDLFLVPSLFEPCGLTQLIALKYGSIPIVRKTGGLADTIFDVETSGLPFEKTNGFSFIEPTGAGLDSALNRALTLWQQDPIRWKQLMVQAMNNDYSWNRSSDRYVEIYQKNFGRTR